MGMIIAADAAVRIDYTNFRGERAWRRVVPLRWVFETTEWHPEEQWIMYGIDLDKMRERGFAMKDIHKWEPAGPAISKGASGQ